MHNDEPALLDALERGPLIEEVGEAIARCKPPQVFGVHGDWGLGKTSFLHQVQWYLTGDCPQQPEEATKEASEQGNSAHEGPVLTVWFDAWRYQNEDTPVVALLHEMRTQLSWQSRAAGSVSRTAEVLTRGALLSLEELTKKIGFQYSKFRQASREWESENLAATLPSHSLRDHLREAIGQLLPKEADGDVSPRLVVFIDDVDRCESEAAFRLLEGLKIYLTLDNCVFVLGMNQKTIEEAIAQRMKTETGYDPTIRAAAYMEKLCQNVWRLPAVRRPEQVLHYLLNETVESEDVRNSLKLAVEAPGYQCLPPNPRRLKGLANLIGRLSARLPHQESDSAMVFETTLLVIVAYIYQFHHALYVRWEADPSLWNRIYEWCRGAERTLEFLAPLELPLQSTVELPTESTPATLASTYPDPTGANVFWIQSLILHCWSEVAPENFHRYLHGAAT